MNEDSEDYKKGLDHKHKVIIMQEYKSGKKYKLCDENGCDYIEPANPKSRLTKFRNR